MSSDAALVWIRDDLRLSDNPALDSAARSGAAVTLLYVLDDGSLGLRPLGGAAKWWLSRSLTAFAAECEAIGLPFAIRRGAAAEVVPEAAREAGAGAVFWNRRYASAERRVDDSVTEALERAGVGVVSLAGRLLREPAEVRSKSGGPLRVAAQFRRTLASLAGPGAPLPRPNPAEIRRGPALAGASVESLRLEPTRPDWAAGFRTAWTPGERGAHEALRLFFDGGLRGYARDRDPPSKPSTSRLSPHLRFGEISPREVWRAIERARVEGAATDGDVEKIHAELGWREFSHHLLHHYPDLPTANYDKRFDAFPFAAPRPEILRAWRKGLTGYPIVDAGMRQLWTTGWMHNRVRMIAASFLVKDLLVDWRVGEAWFWDTLVDADPASNAVNWQWVAGSGPDAAPFFRIFNPSLQGETFDPEGGYVRAFVPELAGLPDRWIHTPWKAPEDALRKAGVALGETYPRPIVEHDQARKRALAAFQSVKAARL